MPTPAWLRDGRKEGMWFRPRVQILEPRYFVIHWTGAENKAQTTFNTLKTRKLSVQLQIDGEGIARQWADLRSRCAHAGDVNEFGPGVEVTCKGFPPALARAPRKRYRDVSRGVECAMLEFTSKQLSTLRLMAEWVCDELEIPRLLPMDARTGKVARYALGSPTDRLSRLYSYRGVLGHMHVPSPAGKKDPGPQPLDWLAQQWGLM